MPMHPPEPDFRSPDFLRGHIAHTLAFYRGRALDPSGGFFHAFRDDGSVYDTRVRHLVSSCRFVFNHAMAYRHAGGDPADQQAARHGLAFVHTAHALPDGGHAWVLDWDGARATPTDATRHAYGAAFVLLAHAHALMAGVAEAAAGLADAFALMEQRFWAAPHGLYADEASPADWAAGRVGPYRGQNANMHACEAMLAAHEATQDGRYLQRALGLAEAVTQRLAARARCGLGDLVWEHFDAQWQPDWGYNRHDRSNIFRPWGFQTGHLTEWAKLLLQLRARLPPDRQPDWLLPTARRFFDTALRLGWDDARGGLVYGFGPDGRVCDGDRYFWVQAESLAAAAWLAQATQDGRYHDAYDRIWRFAWAHGIDHVHGAWFRVLGPDNRPVDGLKSPPGKTDYHTMGACWDVLASLRLAADG